MMFKTVVLVRALALILLFVVQNYNFKHVKGLIMTTVPSMPNEHQ